VKLLADYEQGKDVVIQAKKLAEQHGQDNLTVQLCAGMVLERAGDTEGALEVLSKHQGSLDAYVHPKPIVTWTSWKKRADGSG
jgi:coatomer protein complex subunit epsilon